MGMYTEFHFNSRLKRNVDKDIINILRYMLGEVSHIDVVPDHELFSTDRWKVMLISDSYYFDADTHSTLRFDDISETWYLCVRCNLKNYDSEIEKFVDWITPYLRQTTGSFLGFSRYEEFEQPSLIYHNCN